MGWVNQNPTPIFYGENKMQTIENDLWKDFEKEINKKIVLSDLKVIIPKNINHKDFWDKFLTTPFPEGSINKVLEKNFAIYIIQNNLDIETIKQKYLSQGWKVGALLGWVKKVQAGDILEYNPAEISKWCAEYSPEMLNFLKTEKTTEKRAEYQFVWERDLKNVQDIQNEWLVDRLIPPKSVGVWTGKRGSFKTFLVLNCAFCLAEGLDFLDKYPSKKIRILYLDKENGFNVIVPRVKMVKKGLNIEKDSDIGFICFSQLHLDNDYDIREIEKLISENDINLLVVDTYRRAIGFDENSAGDVSFLFVNTLRPLVEKHNLSIVLIHHDKKGTQGDEMDDIRGSSDLSNYADFILKNERKGKRLILKQLKCRNAPEIEPIEVSVATDETTYIKFGSAGQVQYQSAEEKAVEVLTLWITSRNLKSFKTSEAQAIAFQSGIKKMNFFTALSSLQSMGMIQLVGRGVYNVTG